MIHVFTAPTTVRARFEFISNSTLLSLLSFFTGVAGSHYVGPELTPQVRATQMDGERNYSAEQVIDGQRTTRKCAVWLRQIERRLLVIRFCMVYWCQPGRMRTRRVKQPIPFLHV
jgi:hypothetical protein